MKTMIFTIGMIANVTAGNHFLTETSSLAWYGAGLIAFFLLAYLMYSLIKPEKF